MGPSASRSASATVYSAPIGSDLGSWSGAYPHVYALDFDPVTAAGTYTISVSGPVTASSSAFRITTGKQLYADALSYYQVQRAGPDFIRSALRAAPAISTTATR